MGKLDDAIATQADIDRRTIKTMREALEGIEKLAQTMVFYESRFDVRALARQGLSASQAPFPRVGGTSERMYRPITEDWLIEHGFGIVDGRSDPRLPIRRLVIGEHLLEGRRAFRSPDDICIDVAPAAEDRTEWHVWVSQREPYRHIHVRHMQETWELVRFYEGLTGRVWPGAL